MLKTEELATLIRFREGLYNSLGLRPDSLFELADAVLTTSQRSTLVRLSLTAAFRRRWPNTCDALADGSIDVSALRSLFAHTLVDSASFDSRPVWVIHTGGRDALGAASGAEQPRTGPGSTARCLAGPRVASSQPGPISGW